MIIVPNGSLANKSALAQVRIWEKINLVFMVSHCIYEFFLSSCKSHEHDYVIKWKHFPCYWLFLWGIHQWIPSQKAIDVELWCFLWSAPWINSRVNNREAGDLRCHRADYDVIVMNMMRLQHKCFHNKIAWFVAAYDQNKFQKQNMEILEKWVGLKKIMTVHWWVNGPHSCISLSLRRKEKQSDSTKVNTWKKPTILQTTILEWKSYFDWTFTKVCSLGSTLRSNF